MKNSFKIIDRYANFNPGISLFSGSFFVFLFTFWSVLSGAFYFGYKKNEESHQRHLVIRKEKAKEHLIRIVSIYNEYLVSLYNNLDLKSGEQVATFLSQLGEDKERLNWEKINSYSKENNLLISLIDTESTEIIESTKLSKLGDKLSDWPGAHYFLRQLKPKRVNYRYGFNDRDKHLRLFMKVKWGNGKYVWSVRFKPIENDAMDNLIYLLKHPGEYDPIIKTTGLYSANKVTLHGINGLSLTDFLTENKDLDLEKTQVIGGPLGNKVITEWHVFERDDNNPYAKYTIKYFGVGYDLGFVDSKIQMENRFLFNIYLATIFLSLVLALLISYGISHSVYLIIGSIKKIDNIEKNQIQIPRIWNKELNLLSHTIEDLYCKLLAESRKSRKLAVDILNAKDLERRKISRDLHDTVGQLLVAAKLALGENNPNKAKQLILDASEELYSIYDELEPRHLDSMSLPESIRSYLLKFFPQNLVYHISSDDLSFLSSKSKIAIYKIAQEAIANVCKHANNPESIEISLKVCKRFLTMRIINSLIRSENLENNKVSGRGLRNISLRAESLKGSSCASRNEDEFILEVILPMDELGAELCYQS